MVMYYVALFFEKCTRYNSAINELFFTHWILEHNTYVGISYKVTGMPRNMSHGTPPIDENPDFGTPPIDEISEFGTPPIDEISEFGTPLRGGAKGGCQEFAKIFHTS